MISEKGMMKMREVKDVKIKAKSSTSLKPGGLHLMFMGLKRPLKKDEKIKVTLKFSDSSSLDVDFPVLNK
jgi:copper(I)-binding protein